jgi:nucleotide-binding universal stress UspA family protein
MTNSMTTDRRPVLLAYDGSPESRGAVSTAVTLFPGRKLIVVAVWEPAMAAALASASGISLHAASAEIAAEGARAEHDHTVDTARVGAELARQQGGMAEAMSVTDRADVAMAIASVADRHDACAVVVGSRGLGRVKAPLLGSTSHGLLRRSRRPVLVVRAPE